MQTLFKNLVFDLVHVFVPDLCIGCTRVLMKHEKTICMDCRTELPFTNFQQMEFNPAEALFSGRVVVERANSFLFFDKGYRVQEMISALKYKQRTDIGEYLGSWFGCELSRYGKYDSIDLVIPVPLHPSKERKRGFNQAGVIAKSMASQLNKPFSNELLIRVRKTETQTNKNREDRFKNLAKAFEIGNNCKASHVLLVDDVLTTGATMISATEVLADAGFKVSIATLAIASVY